MIKVNRMIVFCYVGKVDELGFTKVARQQTAVYDHVGSKLPSLPPDGDPLTVKFRDGL